MFCANFDLDQPPKASHDSLCGQVWQVYRKKVQFPSQDVLQRMTFKQNGEVIIKNMEKRIEYSTTYKRDEENADIVRIMGRNGEQEYTLTGGKGSSYYDFFDLSNKTAAP